MKGWTWARYDASSRGWFGDNSELVIGVCHVSWRNSHLARPHVASAGNSASVSDSSPGLFTHAAQRARMPFLAFIADASEPRHPDWREPFSELRVGSSKERAHELFRRTAVSHAHHLDTGEFPRPGSACSVLIWRRRENLTRCMAPPCQSITHCGRLVVSVSSAGFFLLSLMLPMNAVSRRLRINQTVATVEEF
jgi:hypothetical protein